MEAPALRWGILGPGWIAERFARAAQVNTRQEILAVASRSATRAQEFAARGGIPRACGSYEALVTDPEVDVVYVATPHPAHHPCALLALGAGKHTLVEKPIALNAAQAGVIAAAARRVGVFCMEALWSFFLPKFEAIRRVIDDGLLGEPLTVLADHGEHFTPDHRIHDPARAGGPLLDLGTYPVALAVSVLAPPERVVAAGQDAPTGVNGQASILLTHPGARQSVLHTTILSDTPNRAVIAGTEGTLTTAGPFFFPGDFSVRAHGRGAEIWHREEAVGHEALYFEAGEVARCIHAGCTESPTRPLADSLATMAVLDSIRAQIGTVYTEDHRVAVH